MQRLTTAPPAGSDTLLAPAAEARPPAARDRIRIPAVHPPPSRQASQRGVLLHRVTQLTSRLLRASAAMVTFVRGNDVLIGSVVDLSGRFRVGHSVPLETSPCRWAVASGWLLASEDALEDPRTRGSALVGEMGIRGYLAAPVSVAGAVRGMLCVVDDEPRRWTGDEIELARELALLSAAWVEYRLDADENRRLEWERHFQRRDDAAQAP